MGKTKNLLIAAGLAGAVGIGTWYALYGDIVKSRTEKVDTAETVLETKLEAKIENNGDKVITGIFEGTPIYFSITPRKRTYAHF